MSLRSHTLPIRRTRGAFLAPLILSLASFFAFAGGARADVTLNIDQKDGDKVSDVARVVAHADSPDGINKVEFAVDGKIRFTGTSTPYTFNWDTLSDKEGKHALTVTAYDANDKTKSAMLSLEINNDLGLGAPAYVNKAREAMAAQNTEDTVRYVRRALKADPNSIAATRLLANLRANDMDLPGAIGILEKAKGLDASPEALRDLASYRMRFAFLPDNATSFFDNIQAVLDLQQKAADLQVKSAMALSGSSPGPAHMALGDALLNASRTHEAAEELSKIGDDASATLKAHRALALALDQDEENAMGIVHPILQEGAGNAAARAVGGLILIRQHKFAEAAALVQKDQMGTLPASSIVAAYAYVALGNRKAAHDAAERAVKMAPRLSEAYYALSMTTGNLVDSEQQLAQAISLNPLAPGPLLDYATRLALLKKTDRYQDAVRLAEDVLRRNPNDVEAKLVMTLLLLEKNKTKAAVAILDPLSRKDNSPDVQMVVAIFYSLSNNNRAEMFADMARQKDPLHFSFSLIPTTSAFLESWERSWHYRGDFYLTPDALVDVPAL